VFFLQLPFVVLFSREIVCQRRLRCLATGDTGVDKLSDYLRSVKKDVNQAKNPLSLTAVQFGVHESTDGPIANYCNCCCHLSKLKSSRTHPKSIGISVYMSIIVDYTTALLFRMEIYSNQRIVFRLAAFTWTHTSVCLSELGGPCRHRRISDTFSDSILMVNFNIKILMII
jgi:hypothetical protein